MSMQVNNSTGTEPLLYYTIHNQRMKGHLEANNLFYLEECKVSFRCCPDQDLYRIQASFRDTFDPEKIMGETFMPNNFKFVFLTPDGKSVPITRIQIPTQLAERIHAIASSQLAIVEKYKNVQPPHPSGMCAALTKDQIDRLDKRDQEFGQLNVFKQEVGMEFEKFANSQGIVLND